MRLNLIPNWKEITLISYTAMAFYALLLLNAAPDLIFLATGIDTNPVVWSLLFDLVCILGLIGRLVAQPAATAWRRRLIISCIALVVLLLAVPAMAQTTERQTLRVLEPLVIQWEGAHRCRDDRTFHCAYLDIVNVPTICFGETKGVKIGDRATDAECREMLRTRLTNDFRDGLHRYFSETTRRQRLTPHRDAAYVSLAYNVGIRGAGRSTATRRLNNGDIRGGCVAIGWWNKAGGRVVRGLVNRRKEEVALCLRGLS